MNQQERAETRAAEARIHVDELAALIGHDAEVRQDRLTDCVPGDRDSGLELVYVVHVSPAPGADDRLPGEIAGQYTAEGWQVTRDPDARGVVSVRFAKDGFTVAAKVSQADDLATVTGSGGCVR